MNNKKVSSYPGEHPVEMTPEKLREWALMYPPDLHVSIPIHAALQVASAWEADLARVGALERIKIVAKRLWMTDGDEERDWLELAAAIAAEEET